MIEKFQRRNHKKEKIILSCAIGFSVIMIGVFGYLFFLEIKNRPLIDYPKYELSTTDWTGGDVTITIALDDNIGSYSFDGGKSYQEGNSYQVTTNGEIYIMVKDINGKESKMLPISIQNIDKDPPIINFENNTTIALNSKFSLSNGVVVYDGDVGSGLNGNYVIVPDSIDTSVAGVYTVTYTAFDKVGNYTEKVRTITVADVTGTTYYRYRTSKLTPYQCNLHLCNCVVSEAARLNGTCPTGYTLQGEAECCQSCYDTCQETTWSEWSEWSTERITPTASREVETKVE